LSRPFQGPGTGKSLPVISIKGDGDAVSSTNVR
jgi:hypothetical protein